jgi:hypothetical protein
MTVLVTVFLNEKKYRELIGELPECYIRGCNVEVQLEKGKLTKRVKRTAAAKYWQKAGTQGGTKDVGKLLNPELFSFSIF